MAAAGSEAIDTSKVLNVNVGVMGHVDSGKTSLARALSTHFSTASLDKNPQSQERGITLDLGFSAFTIDVPAHVKADWPEYDKLQFTLVDCPGHASLIKTIIGGAQIIDMMLLVIDITKGIQTQTAECLVIAEILMDRMIIVLNKVDQIEEGKRQERIDKTIANLRKALAPTKFKDAPMMPVAARIGSGGLQRGEGAVESIGVSALATYLADTVSTRNRKAQIARPFYFAVDHCFPIKGQGTVLTGTVLSGKVAVGQTVGFPELQLDRKVKSMQMFKQPVQSATVGDRAALCVNEFKAKAMERGIVAEPGSVPGVTAALVDVDPVRFFKFPIKSKSKFHITVGHSTVMATATFFRKLGPSTGNVNDANRSFDFDSEYIYLDDAHDDGTIAAAGRIAPPREDDDGGAAGAGGTDAALAAAAAKALPKVGVVASASSAIGGDLWALLTFDKTVSCPVESIYIASRLDTDVHSSSCRLAFHGRLRTPVDAANKETLSTIKAFKTKAKFGVVKRVVDEDTVIVKDLTQKESDINMFLNLNVHTVDGRQGYIQGSFGASGQIKCVFRDGHGFKVPEKKGRKGKAAAGDDDAESGEGGEGDGDAGSASKQIALRYKVYVFAPPGKRGLLQ